MIRAAPVRRWRALSLRTKPELVDHAQDALARLAGATICGRLRTFETVPTETFACRAT